MENQYYYLRLNQPVGPVSLEELRTAYSNDVINDATSVCIAGDEKWESLNIQPFYSDVVQAQKLALKARATAVPARTPAEAPSPELGYDPTKPEVVKPANDPTKPEVTAAPAMASSVTNSPMSTASYDPNRPDPAANSNSNMSPEDALSQAEEEERAIYVPSLATSWKMQLGLVMFALGVGATILSFTFKMNTGGTFFTAYIGLIGFGVITFYKGYCGE